MSSLRFSNPFSRFFQKSRLSPSALSFWISLAFLAVLLGWTSAFVAGKIMERRALELWDPFFPEKAHPNATSSGGQLSLGLRSFLDHSPFGVPPGEESTPPSHKESPALAQALQELKIIGTMAGVCALGSTAGETVLLQQGQEYHGYLVAMVAGDGVYFDPRDGSDPVIKSLLFGGEGGSVSHNIPALGEKASPPPVRKNIKPAAPGSAGEVSRNLVNSLLMNPFEELKKIRLQPKHVDGAPQGLEVAYIGEDSILATLGVQKGDVVQGVNGIRINHMGDVANAINSLMGGKRFDVTVIREGKKELLSYQVK